MGRNSLADLAHPGRSCHSCSKCNKTKESDPRTFHHVVSWKTEDLNVIKDLYKLNPDCCLCDACRQVVKRGISGQKESQSKKKERLPCFLHTYHRCSESSSVDSEPGPWAEFASKLNLQDCPPAALPHVVPLCKAHYQSFRRCTHLRCAQCSKRINGAARRISCVEKINKFNEEMGTKVILTAESSLCSSCYHSARYLTRKEDKVSSDTELQQKIQHYRQLELQYLDGDMHLHAKAHTAAYTGESILQGPLLLKTASEEYHNSLKAAYKRKGYEYREKASRTFQAILLDLMKDLEHHLVYSVIPHKPKQGTLLMRRGTHVTHALHELMVRSDAESAQQCPIPAPSSSSSSTSSSNAKILLKAAQIINSELRQQSREFAHKAPGQLFTEFDLASCIEDINPMVWNFFYLLSETTLEQRHRDSIGTFNFHDRYHPPSGRSTQDIRRLFNICHALFIMNDHASYPLHTMLADTVQCQGGSQQLIQILNRLGVVSSRTHLDYHKNAVVLSHMDKMNTVLASSPSFRVASIDNIDKGSPHAVVKAEAVARSVHGTSYQLVFPQPTSIRNSGDDFVPCSTGPELCPPEKLLCKKIVRDQKNLYRCLACRNSPQLRSCQRNDDGELGNESDQAEEASLLKPFKDSIIRVMEDNQEIFMDELGSLLPTECLDMRARIELLKKESCTPSEIECAAVTILAQCPVHIYRSDETGRRHLHSVYGSCFKGVEPCLFLRDATGFDLLMTEDLVSSSADLIPFRDNVFRGWKDMNLHLLRDTVNKISVRTAISSKKDDPDDILIPPQQKRVKSRDLYQERRFPHHSYETSRIRAPLPNLQVSDFEIKPREETSIQECKLKLLHYMAVKTLTKSEISIKEAVVRKTEPLEKSQAFYLGVLNQHADDIETVKDTLEQLQKQASVGDRLEHLIVVGDAKTYGHLVRIKQEYVREMKWLLPFPGDWHILKNLQPVLMKIYWHAGLQELAAKNHKGATMTSLAACSHFKRTHRFLLAAWEALYRCQLQAFMKSQGIDDSDPSVRNILQNCEDETAYETMGEAWQHLGDQSLTTLLDNFVKKQGENDATYRLWNNFIHRDALAYVLLYLSIRTGNWDLRVAALKMIGPLFHAFDRPMYLRLIPGHLCDLLQMPSAVLKHLQRGGFVVSQRGRSGQCIALDEAHESLINRDVKMALHKPDPMLMDKLALYLPYRAMGQQKLKEELMPPADQDKTAKLKDRNMEETARTYMDALKGSPLCLDSPRSAILCTLLSGVQADEVQQQDMETFYKTGQEDMESYISCRILREQTVQAPRRKNALRTFLPKAKKKVSVNRKEKQKRIVTACLRRQLAHAKKTGDPIKVLGQYIKLPLAIAKSDGSMYKGNKSVTTKIYMKRYCDVFKASLPSGWRAECVILEGMFLINTVPLGCHKVFGDYLRSLVASFLAHHIQRGAKEVHVVFDHPNRNGLSPKDLERERRDSHQQQLNGAAVYSSITSDTPLPSNWRQFLACREQKRLLVNFLCTYIPKEAQRFLGPGQNIITAGGFDGPLTDKASRGSVSSVEVCPEFQSNHEESDSRVWRHAHITKYRDILIYSPDTDTYHVGLPLVNTHLCNKRVYVQLSLRVNDHMYCDMNEFINKLSLDPDLEHTAVPDRALLLHLTYIISGCDYTSFFSGCGKTAFYAALFQYAHFITSGDGVSGHLTDIDTNEEQALLAYFRLIGSVYFKRNFSSFKPVKSPYELYKSIPKDAGANERTVHELWLNNIREATWARADTEEGIMPSNDALFRHWRRSVWVRKLWEQAPLELVEHPSMEDHGYEKMGEKVTISWDSEKNEELVQMQVDWILKGCKCKTGCSNLRCRCKKEKRACGPGCECLSCTNPHNAGHPSVNHDVTEQIEEENLLQEINADETLEEEILDVEEDAMEWEEDAIEVYCSEDE